MMQLYSEAAETFKFGQKSYWGGLYGSAESLALIEFAKAQNRVVLVIAADINEANSIYNGLRFYNYDLPILTFDSWEVLAFDYFTPHPDISSNRLKTLSALDNLQSGIVISTFETLAKRLCPKFFVKKYSFKIKVNDEINSLTFGEKLIKIGYHRVNTTREHGEFSIKGSIIDLFPMGAKTPYRLDLFDNELESIRTFDPSTQRSIAKITAITLLPAREFPIDDAGREIFQKNYLEVFDNNSDFIAVEVAEGQLPSGIEFYLSLFFDTTNSLFDYLPDDAIIATHKGFSSIIDEVYQHLKERFLYALHDLERPPLPINQVFLDKDEMFSSLKKYQHLVISHSKLQNKPGKFNFQTKPLPPLEIVSESQSPLNKFSKFIKRFNKSGGRILIVCESLGRQKVLDDLLQNQQLTTKNVDGFAGFLQSQNPLCSTSTIGFDLKNGLLTTKIAIITENNLFGADAVQQRRRRRAKHRDFDEAIKSLVEINIGDPIVHENYGVGRYVGLKTKVFDGQTQDFLVIGYADDAQLMVPITSLYLISRYGGLAKESAPLHKLGSSKWSKAKRKACESLFDVATHLLETYAKRAAQTGFSFPAPSDSYSSFVANFAFEETPDQLTTMDAVLADMQAAKPMDRLVCGDVGFGKTEIAMRAAFLAVEAGKQVAILVPTTILANQHYQSFADRFANYAVEIRALSRFQTNAEQRKIKEVLASGGVDIVIGTHKLIQPTIKYKNLGLIIIDEEHRFGVRQKESLKNIRGQSDILTMTATPIPRTLNMAFGELRDLSIISTPPQGRSAIKTFINTWNDAILQEAILRELHRGGQIFVVHNEIDSIDNMAENFKKLVPNIKVRVAHAQMPTRELEQIMRDFYHAKFQMLVATTIIETGIDIPRANTIIINNADRFGLAELHQLRGRVGRSSHKAYAYLLIKSYKLNENAKKRLEVFEASEELGAGFMLANHDLEIRGAGELLGSNQSGKISEIGFNLYNDLLQRTVAAIKDGKKINLNQQNNPETTIDSGISALIPADYLADVHERLIFYKRIANATNDDALKELEIELIDRFGLHPDSVKTLFLITSLKLFCHKIGISKISIYDTKTILNFTQKTLISPEKIIPLIQTQPQTYRLKSPTQLTITTPNPQDSTRLTILKTLLQTLI